MTPGGQGRYRIACAQVWLNRLREWAAAIPDQEHLDQFVSALRTINQGMEVEPATFGDPRFPLRKLGMLVYSRLVTPLQVLYAVDESRRIVYVREFHYHRHLH
jgi:hypothetical protein